MGYIKIKTDSGIRMDAQLNSKADYEKIIKFLQAERDAMVSKPVLKPKKSLKDKFVTDISTGYYEAQRRSKG